MDLGGVTSSDLESDLEKCDIPLDTRTGEYKDKTQAMGGNVVILKGKARPDLKEILRGECENSLRTGAVACGLKSMMGDVREACAEQQGRILRGGVGKEVWCPWRGCHLVMTLAMHEGMAG
ncbi:hypothetical protein ACMFMF_011311 [Clarireedia jacksonii]